MFLVVEIDKKIFEMVSGGDLHTGEAWWCLSKFMNDFNGLSELLIIELAKEIHKVNPVLLPRNYRSIYIIYKEPP